MAKVRGRPFKKGVSGNPKGAPRGVIHEMRNLLASRAPELIDKAVDLAMTGDVAAIRLCMDKIMPNSRSIKTPMPFLKDDALADKGTGVLNALKTGEIASDEALSVLQTIAAQGKIIEANQLEYRLQALELKLNDQKS